METKAENLMAENIRSTLSTLNKMIAEASKAGIRVRVESLDATTADSPFMVEHYYADIEKVERL